MTPTATRLETDMSGWPPVTRHYQVEGGHLAVTMLELFGTHETSVFYCDEHGGSISTTPIIVFPPRTGHAEALHDMGYTVVDDVSSQESSSEDDIVPEEVAEESILDLLPPEIAAAVQSASGSTVTEGVSQ